MNKERLEYFKRTKKFMQMELKKINYEGQGEQDAQEYGKDFDEVMTLAEKALSTEPCEDAISRQAIKGVLEEHWLNGMVARRIIDEIIDKIEALPPVNPTRSKGKWIEKDYWFDQCSAECSVCHERSGGYAKDTGWGNDYSFPKFCPECGAEMEQDDEEEEDDEGDEE